MRKLLLTTAFVLPLSIGPVLAQDAAAPAEEPAADATMATEGDATTPMPADPAADPAAAEPTADEAAAEKEAMAAEVAASGKIAQEQATNELRLDWITDATVTSPDGNAIGDINDLIVDGDSGQMIAAVIGVGGFLGIGEKQIAVPWDQLSVNYDAQEINSDLTKEEAEAAPEYVFREREDAPSVAPAGDMPPADPAAEPADGEMEPAPMDDAAMPEGEAAAPTDDGAMPAEGEAEPMEAEPMEGEAMEGESMEGEHMEGEPVEGEAEQPANN